MLASLARLEPIAYEVTAERDGAPVARATFTRRVLAAGVVRTQVRDGRLRGELYAPHDAAVAPGVIVLGGSDGGNTFRYIAALLAARGFAALATPYFGYEDLPADLAEIPLEYFGAASKWLQARPEVGGRRVGVLGMSRGGELALLLGATFPEVAAVAALVPSGVPGGGIGKDVATMSKAAWTLAGDPIPFLPPPSDPETMQAVRDAFTSGKPFAGTPGFLRTLAAAGERVDEIAIPVERTRGAIFMMSAQDDRIWPSTELTEIAVRRLRRSPFGQPFEHRAFPGAGHLACLPPHVPTTGTAARHPQVPISLEYGGNAKDTAAASAATWGAVLAFLAEHLGGS
jgi:dienelactone hydrolase